MLAYGGVDGWVPTTVFLYSLHGGGRRGPGERVLLGGTHVGKGRKDKDAFSVQGWRRPYIIPGAYVLEMYARVVLGWSFFSIIVFLFTLFSDCCGGESPISVSL